MPLKGYCVWIMVLLCLGGCGTRPLSAAAKGRLDTVGITVASYQPVTIVPPAPANFITALGQYSLHYGERVGSWGSLPLYALSRSGGGNSYGALPLLAVGLGLSMVTATAGAAYGSVYSLLRPPIDAARARQSTRDLRQLVAAIDFQQTLTSVFLSEATATSRHRFELLPAFEPARPRPLLGSPLFFPRPLVDDVRYAPKDLFVKPPLPYHQLKPPHIQSVLELELDQVQFIGTEEALTLVLRGQARLLLPRRHAAAPDFLPVGTIILDFTSQPARYQAWSAADGALLHATLAAGCRTLAQAAIAHWFY